MIAQALVFLIALQHVGFCVLEMFFWNTPKGRKIFRTEPDFAAKSKALAANQGLYNLFLAAGLFLSFFLAAPTAYAFQVFFLGCVFVAGTYGGATVSIRILYLQAGPALLALLALFLKV